MTNAHARELRKNMTDAEQAVWRCIRMRQIEGCKFRRQYPLGDYIVDFVCLEKRIVIEVDGGQHDENAHYDERRTEWLEGQGFRVRRSWNNEVLTEMDGVLEVIREALVATPHPDPPPQGGREKEGPPPQSSPARGEEEQGVKI